MSLCNCFGDTSNLELTQASFVFYPLFFRRSGRLYGERCRFSHLYLSLAHSFNWFLLFLEENLLHGSVGSIGSSFFLRICMFLVSLISYEAHETWAGAYWVIFYNLIMGCFCFPSQIGNEQKTGKFAALWFDIFRARVSRVKATWAQWGPIFRIGVWRRVLDMLVVISRFDHIGGNWRITEQSGPALDLKFVSL